LLKEKRRRNKNKANKISSKVEHMTTRSDKVKMRGSKKKKLAFILLNLTFGAKFKPFDLI